MAKNIKVVIPTTEAKGNDNYVLTKFTVKVTYEMVDKTKRAK